MINFGHGFVVVANPHSLLINKSQPSICNPTVLNIQQDFNNAKISYYVHPVTVLYPNPSILSSDHFNTK